MSPFPAAMIASAFATPSIEKIIAAGLEQIPQTSRLAHLIAQTLEWITPLNDRMQTNLNGLSNVSISELAERSIALG